MLKEDYVRKIGLVDETVYKDESGKAFINVYPLDKTSPEKVILSKQSLRDYRALLTRYPSLMKHAKKGREKLWNCKL